MEDVYGGRINAISIVQLDTNKSLVYIATESANSMFFNVVEHTPSGPDARKFKPVPDMDADDGFGSGAMAVEADGNSGYSFALYLDKIISADSTAGSWVELVSFGARGLKVYRQRLFYLQEEPPGQPSFILGSLIPAAGLSMSQRTVR